MSPDFFTVKISCEDFLWPNRICNASWTHSEPHIYIYIYTYIYIYIYIYIHGIYIYIYIYINSMYSLDIGSACSHLGTPTRPRLEKHRVHPHPCGYAAIPCTNWGCHIKNMFSTACVLFTYTHTHKGFIQI